MRIAIDTGGTFTDCVFLRDGKLEILKSPSQPKNPAAAIGAALSEMRANLGAQAADGLDLICGTTVGTNALLERRGGRVLLITTEGFEDVLEIGRQARAKLYNLQFHKAPPIVPRERRIGARERLAADGSIILALSPAGIHSLVQKVRSARPDAVAICLLFSFRNSKHEASIARALRRAGFLVSVSHEILPEFREFERTSTTVINAYLAPVMSSYLNETQTRANQAWNRGSDSKSARSAQVRVMQSNGGIISSENAAAHPVRTVLSGPAGGLLGAAYAASLAGLEKVITFDMGGTSTDVGLLSGETQITTEACVAGFPVSVPMLEIHTVGAGGGSIARFDRGAALRVGPESAGADPGPICYGGGELPTVTDAHAVLGHFGGRGLLNGGFTLQVERARRALQERKGSFRSVEEFAQGILAVSNAVIERAVRKISIERGHDPRDYTLVAFGGAGGLHACDLAAALEMRGVLLPVFPGALSALGILRADVVRDFSCTVLLPVRDESDTRRRASNVLRQLQRDADRFLWREGFPKGRRRFEHRYDVRYVGQAYDLSVSARAGFLAAFHRAHERAYGHAEPRRPVEIVNVRCRATGLSPRIELPRIGRVAEGTQPPAQGKIKCDFAGRALQAALYEREKLRAGQQFRGPAIVVEYSATSLVQAGWVARVDAYGQLCLSASTGTMRRHAR
jgi:N-methylhydantoinase A